jgi:hemerythrin-like domain-containing protein
MKRSAALTPLSRDHHHGLMAALKLTRAKEADAAAAAAGFLEFWHAEGRRHFQIEEDLLLPGFARHGPADHPAVVRALVEHVDLRRRAQDVERGGAPLAALNELGRRLSAHIREEENGLFTLVEETLPADELAALGQAIDAAEHAP